MKFAGFQEVFEVITLELLGGWMTANKRWKVLMTFYTGANHDSVNHVVFGLGQTVE